MLNFFKKTGRGSSKPDEVTSNTASLSSAIDDLLLEAEKFCAETPENSIIFHDNPIRFIVTNPNALSHFVQFLDSRTDGAATLSLVKFWLDADSFRSAASAEHQLPFNPNGGIVSTAGHETQRTLTKSVSLDDATSAATAAFRPLTDDEKSRVRQTARRRFQTSLATDAVRIFRKYLTTKSPHPVDVPATVLARISLALGGVGTLTEEADDEADGDQTIAASDQPCPDRCEAGAEDDCGRIRRQRDDATTSTAGRRPNTATASDSTRLSSIFEAAQHHVLATLERTHLDAFVESPFYAKHCIDVLTGDTMHMTDILQCHSALFYLAEFLEQDGRRGLLEFWVAAKNFRQQLFAGAAAEDDDDADDADSDVGLDEGLEQAQSDALVLYDRYFSLQAPAAHRLGLSDTQRTLVEQQICTTRRAVLAGCFDGARRVVERYLEQKYFRAFVTSPLFGRYLAELLRKIDGPDGARSAETVVMPPGTAESGVVAAAIEQRPDTARHPHKTTTLLQPTRHRKSASVSSICTQNTLLATDTRSRIVAAKALTASSMQIDGRQLSDPEALWRRRPAAAADCGRLCFGRVNAMGRYERDFDVHAVTSSADPHDDGGGGPSTQQPALTASSTLMRAVRRLVRLPEDRAKEDLAWEVAEMIVRDITNVTLRGQIGAGDAAEGK